MFISNRYFATIIFLTYKKAATKIKCQIIQISRSKKVSLDIKREQVVFIFASVLVYLPFP